jgi:mRNA-degrading endonuclease RelE of RelBE toxin-antitoxin system
VKAYRARYIPEAAIRIRKLHPQIKREIREGIKALLDAPLSGHELHFELAGYRSLRVRTQRVVYQINDEDGTVDIILVGPRRSIYEELRTMLLEQERRNS